MRASTSSPTRFISSSSTLTSRRMVESSADDLGSAGTRSCRCSCSTDSTADASTQPCDTRISPIIRLSPAACAARATRRSSWPSRPAAISSSPVRSSSPRRGATAARRSDAGSCFFAAGAGVAAAAGAVDAAASTVSPPAVLPGVPVPDVPAVAVLVALPALAGFAAVDAAVAVAGAADARVAGAASTKSPCSSAVASTSASASISATSATTGSTSTSATSTVVSVARRSTSSEMSRLGSPPEASMPANRARSASVDASSAEARSLVRLSSPSRMRPSRFSATWPTRSTREKPKKPDVPLIVCIERKMAATLSASCADSSATRRESMLSRFS